MNKIKISVIGTGHLGSVHTKLWKECETAELVGIYDIDKEKSNLLAKQYDCKAFNNIDEAIDACDAVTIAAPTSVHFSIGIKCIEKRKHCLIEKPITSTYQEAKELIIAAKENKVLVQVGHVERFNPAIAAIKKYSMSPKFIETHRLSQFRPRAIDVSVIHDLMIHDIDIILWLVKSKIKKIDANGVNVLTKTADIANARLSFENGCVANITASRISANPMRKMRIFQENAYFSIDFAAPEVEVYYLTNYDETHTNQNAIPATMLGKIDAGLNSKNIYFEKPEIPSINAIAEEQKAFVQSILTNAPISVGADEAANALYVAETISNIIAVS